MRLEGLLLELFRDDSLGYDMESLASDQIQESRRFSLFSLGTWDCFVLCVERRRKAPPKRKVGSIGGCFIPAPTSFQKISNILPSCIGNEYISHTWKGKIINVCCFRSWKVIFDTNLCQSSLLIPAHKTYLGEINTIITLAPNPTCIQLTQSKPCLKVS